MVKAQKKTKPRAFRINEDLHDQLVLACKNKETDKSKVIAKFLDDLCNAYQLGSKAFFAEVSGSLLGYADDKSNLKDISISVRTTEEQSEMLSEISRKTNVNLTAYIEYRIRNFIQSK